MWRGRIGRRRVWQRRDSPAGAGRSGPARAPAWARGLALLIALGAAGLAGFNYFFPQPPHFSPRQAVGRPPPGPVLVVAPHNDDEVIGAAGLMRRAAAGGARVTVALVTNGDGFTVAAERRFLRLLPRPAEYRRLGELRQSETLGAIAELGLGRDAVVFLGYPDGGISRLWETHWDVRSPYRSRFTGTDRSPYPNSYRPGAPYAGAALAEDLVRLLGQVMPGLIVYPHPGDAHPDHWATHNFVAYAVEVWRQRGAPWAKAVEEWTYLVHRGDWPAPKGMHPEANLVPPAPLLVTGEDWFRFDLTPEEVAAKGRALGHHATQTAIMRRYLQSFARQNELFARMPREQATPLPPRPGLTRGPRWPDWNAEATRVPEPVADTVARDAQGAADIAAVALARDEAELFVGLELRAPVSARVRYVIRARAVTPDATAAPAVSVSVRPGAADAPETNPAGTAARALAAGRRLAVAIPLAALDRPAAIIVGASAEYAGIVVDRSKWVLVRLPGEPVRRRWGGPA